jgi:hypothetical protein
MSPSAPARSGAGRRVGLTLRDARRAAGGDSEAAEGALWREEDRHRDHPRAEVVGCGGLSPGVRARGPWQLDTTCPCVYWPCSELGGKGSALLV